MFLKKLCHAGAYVQCLLNSVLNDGKCGGFNVAVSDDPVLPKSQTDETLIGTPKLMFQYQTFAAGFHI